MSPTGDAFAGIDDLLRILLDRTESIEASYVAMRVEREELVRSCDRVIGELAAALTKLRDVRAAIATYQPVGGDPRPPG